MDIEKRGTSMQKTLLSLTLLAVIALPGCLGCCGKKGCDPKSGSPKSQSAQSDETFDRGPDEIVEVDFDEGELDEL